MFLSLIVPVYNVEKYLSECLDSLLHQDISCEEYERICVNDGSTDGSLEILHHYAQNYANIRVIDQENGGVSSARNTGIEAAAGDYIWMVDSDDLIAHHFLKHLYEVSQMYSPDIIDFGAYSFYENLSEEEKTAYIKGNLPVHSFANTVYITRSVFKRDFLLRNHMRFETEIAYSEDSLFKCECLVAKPAVFRDDKMGYLVRYRRGSAVTLASLDALKKKYHSSRIAALKFREYYREADTELKSSLAGLLMTNLWQSVYAIIDMPFSEGKKYLKELHADGLFPFRKPKECCVRRSYQTNRTDIVGKIYDMAYINMHRPWGLAAMKLLRAAINAKKKLVK